MPSAVLLCRLCICASLHLLSTRSAHSPFVLCFLACRLRILNQTVSELASLYNFTAATRVLWTGCSAGGQVQMDAIVVCPVVFCSHICWESWALAVWVCAGCRCRVC